MGGNRTPIPVFAGFQIWWGCGPCQFALASQALARGDSVHAAFLLRHAGQPPLPDWDFAKVLDVAARDDHGRWTDGGGISATR